MLIKAEADDFVGRFREIISDPLNLLIRRVPTAGVVTDGQVCLHNGIKVPIDGPGSYYGGFSQILSLNRGVHEPLEEFVFQKVMETAPAAPAMLELGAYWGHYSMWLKKVRTESTVFLVEPEIENLEAGRSNFARNGFKGEFIQAFVGRDHFRVDEFLRDRQIDHLDILHSDIQGYEMEMLECCTDLMAGRKITRTFISTHSQDLHLSTIAFLKRFGYRIEASADFENETTSYDGFVFASSPEVPPVLREFVPLSRVEIAKSTPQALIDYIVKVAKVNNEPAERTAPNE
jgi:hypothetical protein